MATRNHEESIPRCNEVCPVPEGTVLRRNCPGPLRIIDATDITAIPDTDGPIVSEMLGIPVDVKVCRNPAAMGNEALRLAIGNS